MICELTYDVDIATITIEGLITVDNAARFQQKLDEVRKSDVKKLNIDLSKCQAISSVGIGKLLMFHKDFHQKNKQIEIIKCSLPIYELFMTIKLNQLITINI
jgi:anti-anti-sigma factor